MRSEVNLKGIMGVTGVYRPTLEDWAFGIIGTYAERGTCIRRKAGAVGFDEHNRIVGLGMNGVPRGLPHCIETPCPGATDEPGDTNNCWAIHAEINMLVNSSDPAAITKIYVSTTPCQRCGLVLANLPQLKEVHAITTYADRRGMEILTLAGVEVTVRKET